MGQQKQRDESSQIQIASTKKREGMEVTIGF